MAFEMRREDYIALYGPTQGDRIRLGDTNLIAYIEKDYAEYGNEVVGGAGKTLRDGMMTANLVSKELELTAVLQGAVIIDPILGVIKADIGIRDGYIVAIGRAGNPDIQDHVDLVIGPNTLVLPGQGMIATPGGLDIHVHFGTPQIMWEALSSGLTTLIGASGIETKHESTLHRMHESFSNIPLNVGFLGKGSSSRPEPIIQSIEWGACALKMHEDLGVYPEVIDCCLTVADQMDVQAVIHTDGINESCHVEETIDAFRGRTIHAYHIEGCGGGHPDVITMVGASNVLPSSTTPTNPYTISTTLEHFDMIMTVHRGSHLLPEDVAFARSRIREKTVAAEDVLHDMGAISMMGSDSNGMGRIGEVICRTWQIAHKMKRHLGSSGNHDNDRILRYIAKYTINPAITHGIADYVGSLEVGKLADIVLWRPGFFGAKPEMIIKGGWPAWGPVGNGNASIGTSEPLIYRPRFGGFGDATSSLCLSFVSAASLENGIEKRLRTRRKLVPVRKTRNLRKGHMVRNDLCPPIKIDPKSGDVTLNGEVITCEPVDWVPLNQLYFLG